MAEPQAETGAGMQYPGLLRIRPEHQRRLAWFEEHQGTCGLADLRALGVLPASDHDQPRLLIRSGK